MTIREKLKDFLSEINSAKSAEELTSIESRWKDFCDSNSSIDGLKDTCGKLKTLINLYHMKFKKKHKLKSEGVTYMMSESQVLSLMETWSNKYKRSIDCKNPKGFSQKAHCQARKKRKSGEPTKSKSPFQK